MPIIRIVIPALISLMIGFLLSQIDKRNSKGIIEAVSKEHILIRLPKAYLWIGCIEILFFISCMVLMTLFPNETSATWVWVTFGLLILSGVALVLKTLFWRIDVFRRKNYFYIRTLPFRTYKVAFSDCEFYKYGTNTLTLKTKERTFRIDAHATNFEFLLAMLTQYKVTAKK